MSIYTAIVGIIASLIPYIGSPLAMYITSVTTLTALAQVYAATK